MKLPIPLVLVFTSLFLIACGGGGSSSPSSTPNTNSSPNDSSTGTSSSGSQTYSFDDTISFISSAAPSGQSLHIAKTTTNGQESEVTYLTNSNYNDYKPVISPDGEHIAFFRAFREGSDFFQWKTAIYVMDIDGANLRQLTDDTYMNTEPYWARDGSKRIVWNRMISSSLGRKGTYVYETDIDAEPGDERQISGTNWEWSNSNLQDGRVFVQRNDAYYLMTPNGTSSIYEEISYPDTYHYLHKLSISDDETMIAYMKKVDPDGDDYYGSQIVYADFDVSVPEISNEVVMVPKDTSKFSWYVSISEDNRYIIYAEDGKIMLHDVESGNNVQVSTRGDIEYRYPTFEHTSK